jgi:hypothetical protein
MNVYVVHDLCGLGKALAITTWGGLQTRDVRMTTHKTMWLCVCRYARRFAYRLTLFYRF